MNADARKASLFRNNRNQAVRIPKDFELPGNEVLMRKDGDRLIIEPVVPASLLGLLQSLEPLDIDLPEIDDLPPRDVDL